MDGNRNCPTLRAEFYCVAEKIAEYLVELGRIGTHKKLILHTVKDEFVGSAACVVGVGRQGAGSLQRLLGALYHIDFGHLHFLGPGLLISDQIVDHRAQVLGTVGHNGEKLGLLVR